MQNVRNFGNIRQGSSAFFERLSTRDKEVNGFLINYIPVIEKIVTYDGKDKQTTWKGRIINMPGYKITDISREAVEKQLRTHLTQKHTE